MIRRAIDIIEAAAPEERDASIERWCTGRSAADLLAACVELDGYRRREANLYKRVRALFFLAAIHRYHLPACPDFARAGRVPYDGFRRMLERRFEEAISRFRQAEAAHGPNETLSSP